MRSLQVCKEIDDLVCGNCIHSQFVDDSFSDIECRIKLSTIDAASDEDGFCVKTRPADFWCSEGGFVVRVIIDEKTVDSTNEEPVWVKVDRLRIREREYAITSILNSGEDVW